MSASPEGRGPWLPCVQHGSVYGSGHPPSRTNSRSKSWSDAHERAQGGGRGRIRPLAPSPQGPTFFRCMFRRLWPHLSRATVRARHTASVRLCSPKLETLVTTADFASPTGGAARSEGKKRREQIWRLWTGHPVCHIQSQASSHQTRCAWPHLVSQGLTAAPPPKPSPDVERRRAALAPLRSSSEPGMALRGGGRLPVAGLAVLGQALPAWLTLSAVGSVFEGLTTGSRSHLTRRRGVEMVDRGGGGQGKSESAVAKVDFRSLGVRTVRGRG